MTYHCFKVLCQRIIFSIDEEKLKSEAYIDAFLKNKSIIYNAHNLNMIGYISGEAKLAVILRDLASNDAVDLVKIFVIYSDHCTKIMYKVLTLWIIPSEIGMINMTKYLEDDCDMDIFF